MVTNVFSGGVHGIEGYIVSVETDISNGMPMFEMSGNLGSEVREAKDRVRTAISNTGFSLPVKRITVNLSPSDKKKYGTTYDLPVAVSVLAAMGIIGDEFMNDTLFAGELMLSGQIRPVRGILPMVMCARQSGFKRCMIPYENKKEGSVVSGIEIIGVKSLGEVVEILRGNIDPQEDEDNAGEKIFEGYEYDLSQVSGQLFAKRGIEIAASGYHNILMTGPPGAGKTMLAKCIPSIMPPLTEDESLLISAIYSVGGMLSPDEGIITTRPFIAPHHTTTAIAMIGGGTRPRPGAVSYATGGVLFMDEFPEFSRNILETLRQPLEDRKVKIVRSLDTIDYPADFMLVAAMNPCPCGAFPDLAKCSCTPVARQRYLSKLSKPLLDRIDVCISAQKVEAKDLVTTKGTESSEVVRQRVIKTHLIQQKRFENTSITFNSQMGNKEIIKYCELGREEKKLMETLSQKNELSARGYYRVLKVARTIADMDGEEYIKERHLIEAVRLKYNMR